MSKILSIILYAGIGKEEFNALKKDTVEQNRTGLFWYSLGVMIFFGVLGIYVSWKKGIFIENTFPYFGTAASMALIMISTRLIDRAPRKEVCVRVLMCFFMAILYAEAITVTLSHPNLPSVTFIGILLMLPLLFVDSPIVIMSAQALFVAIFCLLVAKHKDPSVSPTDIWNGITFLIASWAELLIMIPLRIASSQKTKRIEFLSANDLLTGVLNRNAYEECLKKIPGDPDRTLVCVYADVNGLHDVNNSFGHAAGDRMLKRISEELVNAFGHDETYRIGGDEYVVLSVNRDVDTVLQLLNGIENILLAENYHVSFGISAIKDHNMDIQCTIKDAQRRMYDVKTQFYAESGVSRRPRSNICFTLQTE